MDTPKRNAGADGIVDLGLPSGGTNPYPIGGSAGAQDNYPLIDKVIDGRVQRPPFRIDSNADFNAEHGVSSGSGTELDPWIIEGLEIDQNLVAGVVLEHRIPNHTIDNALIGAVVD